MEEKMSKLVTLICLLGVAGLLMVGGCTPESENTWSESLDFSALDPRLNTVSGTYWISCFDDRFTTLTLFQTGNTVQGHDNMRRTWRGTAYGVLPPDATSSYGGGLGFEIQTNDGPEGQVVLAGHGKIVMDITMTCYRCLEGVMYQGDLSGSFDSLGPVVPCELEAE
jgi:hypothetical protein